MAYKDFDGSASTQTVDERAIEARRIISRIRDQVLQANERDENCKGWTAGAMQFVIEKIGEFDLTGTVHATPKQLFWLRDLAEMVD